MESQNVEYIRKLISTSGLCMLPLKEGEKYPLLDIWKPYQEKLPNESEISSWADKKRWGIVCGKVSGNLEVIDFDEKVRKGIFETWKSLLSLNDLELLKTLPLSQTINNGYHLLYRCMEIEKNTVLAKDKIKDKNGNHKALIETRGEGGFIVEPPTDGYIHLNGSLENIPEITPEQRETFLDVARALNEVVEEYKIFDFKPNNANHGNRPGDDFNTRATWDQVLLPHGWKLRGGFGDGKKYWIRPDKKDGGISATENYNGNDLLHVFSSSTSFEPDRSYTKFSAYTILNYNKDFKKAAKELMSMGYGKKNAEKIKELINVSLPPRERITKCPEPTEIIDFLQWTGVIKENFPDLLFASKVSASIVCQFLIKDITNPFALVLVDVPSSGKTIAINFFSDIPELTYATDRFTPASFVSNAANVKKEKLKDVDLLPRIQYKMFLIRDLATLFSKRDDDLNDCLGILTRVLDGEGLNTDSGIHGQREYSGEYLFMILAASTPIPPRVWKMMGNLGSRLFFLKINSRDKSEKELVEQLGKLAYKEKEKICRVATKNLLYGLWNKYPAGVEWDKSKDSDEVKSIIVRCAKLLASLRGVVNVWKEDSFESGYKYETPVVEKPDRINQLFYNLCRGHALLEGRQQISFDDLKFIIELCFDSVPTHRASLFRKVIKYNGLMTVSEIEKELNCSKPTALREMKILEILKICKLNREGRDDSEVSLYDEFNWFLSEEFKRIRGI